jgi:hypothetical protein
MITERENQVQVYRLKAKRPPNNRMQRTRFATLRALLMLALGGLPKVPATRHCEIRIKVDS